MGQDAEEVAEVQLGVESMKAGGGDEGEQVAGGLGVIVAADKEPGVSADGYPTQLALGGVVRRLEHPAEAFAYFRREGMAELVCEEKHMGSRAVVIVCRDAEAARRRFGVRGDALGACYTRTGRPFFDDPTLERALLDRVRLAVEKAGLWAELASDWLVLDCELMPWSLKAQALLRTQYAQVGAAGRAMLGDARAALEQARHRLIVPHHTGPSAYVGINHGTIAPYLYARGFFDAAANLVGEPGHFNDITVYAVLYLIRHGAEICLKDILTSWSRIEQTPPPKLGHDLARLWAAARPVVDLIDAFDDETGMSLTTDLFLVDDCIAELHAHDPRGDAFRYPTSLQGHTHLAQVDTIDKPNLEATAQKLSRMLLGWVRHLGNEANNVEAERRRRGTPQR